MKREERVNATREALLAAAERLFAERGVHAVANREISQAAEQGNNTAVVYHFGTKADVVRAIVRRHAEPIGRRREQMMTNAAGSTDPRDWVACLVRPLTEHLEALGSPTWYARFTAQVRADPTLAAILTEESVDTTPALLDLAGNLARCLPGIPGNIRAERAMMARHLVVQMAIDRERALAAHSPTHHATWAEAADSLIDAITGLWQAPVTLPGTAKA
ncbi:TetR family transcriptional regulator [Actinoplanes sp. NPDC051851]|uniref:TetR/AcrR family transcriptional regulator n=1 Tax=Actinoplanes sp. NPDC051851 TaxID=3154753 RepID=UPI0034295362